MLIHDILELVRERGNTLYRDWIARISAGRPIWKHIYSRYDNYSLEQLQQRAKQLGIPATHKSKGDLIALIEYKVSHNRNDEKADHDPEGREEKIAPEIQQ